MRTGPTYGRAARRIAEQAGGCGVGSSGRGGESGRRREIGERREGRARRGGIGDRPTAGRAQAQRGEELGFARRQVAAGRGQEARGAISPPQRADQRGRACHEQRATASTSRVMATSRASPDRAGAPVFKARVVWAFGVGVRPVTPSVGTALRSRAFAATSYPDRGGTREPSRAPAKNGWSKLRWFLSVAPAHRFCPGTQSTSPSLRWLQWRDATNRKSDKRLT